MPYNNFPHSEYPPWQQLVMEIDSAEEKRRDDSLAFAALQKARDDRLIQEMFTDQPRSYFNSKQFCFCSPYEGH
jgi:hypothetical protein